MVPYGRNNQRGLILEDMISDLKKLSEALDAAAPAPGAKLAATVRAEQVRIQQEIQERGVASITVDGRTFKVIRAPRK
jgi:hypothetical protein